VVVGSGVSPAVLLDAGVENVDLFIAVTDADEVNLVACILAHQYRAKRKIARIKSVEYLEQDSKLSPSDLGIDLLINPQSVVANAIFNVVAYSAATEVAEFADGRVVFIGYPIRSASPLANVTLRELGTLRGMYRLVVTALQREGATRIPRGDDVILPGDTVFFLCNKQDLPAVRYLFGLEHEKVRRVFVLGGGRVGRSLAARLAHVQYRVTIIDHSAETCEQLAQDMDHVEVLHAEGTDLDVLVDEGLSTADIFCAVTQHDQTNILCALLAKSKGVKRVAALVNEPTFVQLAPTLGVDACISPRLATAAAILKHVRGDDVLTMAMLEQGGSEVVELSIPAESRVAGLPLAELKIPEGSIVGVIVRGDEVIVPSGQDHLEALDHVIVFALPEAIGRVERYFGSP
jgi:trk system potassium uptake protein TrkA